MNTDPADIDLKRRALYTYMVVVNSGFWLALGVVLVGVTG